MKAVFNTSPLTFCSSFGPVVIQKIFHNFFKVCAVSRCNKGCFLSNLLKIIIIIVNVVNCVLLDKC